MTSSPVMLSLLAALIMLLILLIMLGLGVYYYFNRDKVNAWILGDRPENYYDILNIKQSTS